MRRLTIFSLFAMVISTAVSQNTNSPSNNSDSFSIIRTSTGISGSSNTILTSNGNYLISQSIGQSSPIGTGSNAGFILRQGYQQPSILADISLSDSSNKLRARIYPNPFQSEIFISFSERITKDIKIFLFDVKGSLIYTHKYAPSQLIKLDLGDITNGHYILNVESINKFFSTKLIKR